MSGIERLFGCGPTSGFWPLPWQVLYICSFIYLYNFHFKRDIFDLKSGTSTPCRASENYPGFK